MTNGATVNKKSVKIKNIQFQIHKLSSFSLLEHLSACADTNESSHLVLFFKKATIGQKIKKNSRNFKKATIGQK